ncbi:helix-hairpin-helix domain-containing protein [Lysinimonas soli]|uniref:Helix-hairpin-helix domain-containing protein n=1 Tax=Lysinimonas soli TaxID=1074233 RepID=A0ABW0NQD8_9MICO
MSAVPAPDARRARVRVGAGAALVLVLLGLGCAVVVTAVTPRGASSVVAPSSPAPSTAPGPRQSSAAGSGSGTGGAAVIYVHILGQVNEPGLYALHDGDRGVDVVAAAGGFTSAADPGGLNLARFLSDGEQIVVPAVGEAVVAGSGAAGPGAGTVGGKVNLNTADEATLETLPRVGPAMAARILAWRAANGRFTAIEDLMSVSGIGEKTFDGLKDLVTV